MHTGILVARFKFLRYHSNICHSVNERVALGACHSLPQMSAAHSDKVPQPSPPAAFSGFEKVAHQAAATAAAVALSRVPCHPLDTLKCKLQVPAPAHTRAFRLSFVSRSNSLLTIQLLSHHDHTAGNIVGIWCRAHALFVLSRRDEAYVSSRGRGRILPWLWRHAHRSS